MYPPLCPPLQPPNPHSIPPLYTTHSFAHLVATQRGCSWEVLTQCHAMQWSEIQCNGIKCTVMEHNDAVQLNGELCDARSSILRIVVPLRGWLGGLHTRCTLHNCTLVHNCTLNIRCLHLPCPMNCSTVQRNRVFSDGRFWKSCWLNTGINTPHDGTPDFRRRRGLYDQNHFEKSQRIYRIPKAGQFGVKIRHYAAREDKSQDVPHRKIMPVLIWFPLHLYSC